VRSIIQKMASSFSSIVFIKSSRRNYLRRATLCKKGLQLSAYINIFLNVFLMHIYKWTSQFI